MFAHVVVAGTFDSLHKGHRLLIEKALSMGKHVHIGLTSDLFVKDKNVRVRSFSERKKSLLKFLGRRVGKSTIFTLEDAFGPAISDKQLEAIVVTEETELRAKEINDIRGRSKLKALEIIRVPLAYANDLKKISDERIRKKEIDAEGNRRTPLIIAIGSANKSKLEGVQKIVKKIFKFPTKVKGIQVPSRIGKQPVGERTIEGALFRAMEARSRLKADYYVGLESGLFEFKGKYFDMLWCAILDEHDVTLGNSMGFEIKKELVDEMVKNNKDMCEIFSRISGIKEIGKEEGAIGYLSKGITKRSEMVEQAFLCAMIPRIGKTL
ncbi:inosine/xanthosine triphosphatase [Candidatus Micrarchaeota archaeon]|nr:inosine/xanthosine triphosphatase [Candidatus Micrarchaeota archaeon]